MNVVVIGAGGFLGGYLCLQFLKRGHNVVGYDILPPQIESKRITFFKHDIISDPIEITSGVDCVFYLAQSPYYRSFPEGIDHLMAVNSLGPVNAAAAAVKAGAKFYCFASTGNVYAHSFESLSEESDLNRKNPYSLSKIIAEEALDLFRNYMIVVSVRLFGIFGRGQRNNLPADLLNAIKTGRRIELEPSLLDPSDEGGLKLSFIYVEDVVHCLVLLTRLAFEEITLPSRVNVAGPEPISIRRFAETIGRMLSKKPAFEVSKRIREFDLIADISRLQSLISPTFTPLVEAMTQTYGSKI